MNDAPALARADLGISFYAETKLRWRRSIWPKKRWEDDINDFHKQNPDERKIGEPLERKNQNNNTWINIASDRKEWTRLEENTQ